MSTGTFKPFAFAVIASVTVNTELTGASSLNGTPGSIEYMNSSEVASAEQEATYEVTSTPFAGPAENVTTAPPLAGSTAVSTGAGGTGRSESKMKFASETS